MLHNFKFSDNTMTPSASLRCSSDAPLLTRLELILQCPVCHDTVVDPRVSLCGHVACFSCWMSARTAGAESHRYDCMMCRGPVVTLRKCFVLQELVNALPITTSCGNQVARGSLRQHVNECIQCLRLYVEQLETNAASTASARAPRWSPPSPPSSSSSSLSFLSASNDASSSDITDNGGPAGSAPPSPQTQPGTNTGSVTGSEAEAVTGTGTGSEAEAVIRTETGTGSGTMTSSAVPRLGVLLTMAKRRRFNH